MSELAIQQLLAHSLTRSAQLEPSAQPEQAQVPGFGFAL